MTGVNMRFEFYNENPAGRNVGDCTVRAISKALGQSWDATYWNLCIEGNLLKDMPSSNAVWGAYLRRQGFERDIVRDDMSVADFAAEISARDLLLISAFLRAEKLALYS